MRALASVLSTQKYHKRNMVKCTEETRTNVGTYETKVRGSHTMHFNLVTDPPQVRYYKRLKDCTAILINIKLVH